MMEKCEQYDVVIAGGGTAGVAAAIGAAKSGARTILIERNPYLGGEATHSGVAAFVGLYSCGGNPVKVVAGAADLILEEMQALDTSSVEYVISATGNKNVNFHPEYLKCAMDNLLCRYGVNCLLHTRIIGAETEDGKLTTLRCVDDEQKFLVRGTAFVDATGDANLVHLAGGKTLWGDKGGNVQAATLPFRLSNVDTSCDLSPAAVEKAICKAKQEGMEYLTKEKGFILKRESSHQVAVLLPSVIPEGLTGQELTRMEQDTRRQVLSYVKALRTYMPGMEQCELAVIGPAIGFRETRRMEGRATITAEDVLLRRKQKDSVARGGWKPEIHKDVQHMGEYMDVEEGSYFDIPLGALQCADFDNLYGAGRLVSSDSEAFAAVRVMGSCFATGHAAGVAAAIQALSGSADVKKVQKELEKQNALI